MVTIKGLTFSYGKEKLFHNLSLSLEPGNIYGLLGLNGAGKSTLLKLLCGLIYGSEGECRILGYDSSKRRPQMLSEIFILPEELSLPGVTAKSYMKSMAPFYPRFDQERFWGYMDEFKLPPKKVLTKYSYGMKKKFLLSMGLSANTKLFILDEPSNGLDIPSKGQFRRLVAEAITDERTFVISTHQVRDVENLIDPVIILNQAQILLNASLEDIGSRIKMVQTATKPDENSPDFLYSEPCVGGFWHVRKSDEGFDDRIDMEILFNFAVSNPAKTKELFAKEAVL